ncbi:type IIB DNA topoisomerase [Cryptosporidium felis]|nr:type IIB DNA topoisomerase [Cryptosporidium felis]
MTKQESYRPYSKREILSEKGAVWKSENSVEKFSCQDNGELQILARLEEAVRKLIESLLEERWEGKMYSSACLVSVMNILHRNLKEGYHSTLRDIYYNNPKLYRKQKVSDKFIAQVTHLVKIPRELLNVVSTAKGRVRGPFLIHGFEFGLNTRGEKKKIRVDCMSIFESMGHSISPYLFKGMNGLKFTFYSEIKFVLVVEKDTIFQRLLEFGFHEKFNNECILITARGFSDLPTRTLLYRLSLGLPEKTRFWILCDYDCFGLSIAATYVLGGKSDVWFDSSFDIPKLLPFKVPSVQRLIENGLLSEDNVFGATENEISRIEVIRKRLVEFENISDEAKLEWDLVCRQMCDDKKRFEIDCIIGLEKWLTKSILSKLDRS